MDEQKAIGKILSLITDPLIISSSAIKSHKKFNNSIKKQQHFNAKKEDQNETNENDDLNSKKDLLKNKIDKNRQQMKRQHD